MDSNSQLDTAIDAALEARSTPAVPGDFAARVRRALPAQRPVRRTVQAGRTAAMVSAAVLVVAVFAVAPHAAPDFSNWTFDFELTLIAQLVAITWWLATPTSRSH